MAGKTKAWLRANKKKEAKTKKEKWLQKTRLLFRVRHY